MKGNRVRNTAKPTPLKVYGGDLPWISSASHLGNELNDMGNMEQDCLKKRARFIDSSI